ncbi:MAG: type I secretion protein TolC [Gammaproteobacteria bacterium]|nr:MAG: type I secretion protein TolC [Gammaproteobacteria bacterium]
MNHRMQKLLSKLVLLALLGYSQMAAAQDLVTVYSLALENDAALQIAESDYLAATQLVPFARAGNRPQISLNANASASEIDDSNTDDSSETNTGYSLNLTQSLYDNVVTGNINAAEATVAARLAQVQAARQDLILRVAQVYFGILAAHDNVDFTYAERTAIARQLEQAEKRFEVGLIAITDVHEAQARFDTSDAQVILAENILENAYQSLVVITGQDNIRKLSRLGDDLKLEVPQPSGSDAWVKLALEFNRDLIAAKQNLDAARFERDKNARLGYPTLDFVARYADTDLNTDDDFRDDSRRKDLSVGLELEVPLYTGGRISSEQARSESEYASAQNSVLLQNRLATQQARTAYLDVVSGISSVKAFKQALASTNIALEATQAGFEVGTRTSVDVLISVRETFRANLEYAGSRYEFLINSLKLRQAAGVLQENDLAEINRWLGKQ